MQRHFRILDIGLALGGPEREIDPVAWAYRRFEVPSPDPTAPRPLEIELGADAVRVDRTSTPLVPALDRTAQLYHRLQMGLMDTIDTHAVLHAAALEAPDGRVALLAAPSGHGKSSLNFFELASRGWRFLGDDYAPLSFEDLCITPYPRAVGLVPGGSAPIPEAFRVAASRCDQKLLSKSLVDVGLVLGEEALVREPLRLGHVFLLSSGRPRSASRATRVVLAARDEHADSLDELFRETPGVHVRERDQGDGFRSWTLSLEHDDSPTERLSEVLSADRVLFFEKQWDDVPAFDGPVTAEPIKRRLTAEHLGRELLNRRAGGALLNRFENSLPRLFMDIAGALADVHCWTVKVGSCADTADTIAELAR